MANIPGHGPIKPNIPGAINQPKGGETSEASKTAATQAAATKSTITTKAKEGTGTSTGTGTIGKAPQLPPPDKPFTPQQMAVDTKTALDFAKNNFLMIDGKNLAGLGKVAKDVMGSIPKEAKLDGKQMEQVSTFLATAEKNNPGSVKESLTRTLSGENGLLIKDTALDKSAVSFLSDPASTSRTLLDGKTTIQPDKVEHKQFDMFTLLLLLDKLASVNYDSYRQMMRKEQETINMKFDEKKSQIMNKAVTGLLMGVATASFSMVMTGISMKQMSGAQNKAIKMTMKEGTVPMKEGKINVDKAMGSINENPKMARNFSKNYHSAMMQGSTIQQFSGAITQSLNSAKEFMSSMYDVGLTGIEKEMSEARFSQDEFRSLRQESNKMEQRAYDAAKDIESQKFATMKAVAAKMA